MGSNQERLVGNELPFTVRLESELRRHSTEERSQSVSLHPCRIPGEYSSPSSPIAQFYLGRV